MITSFSSYKLALIISVMGFSKQGLLIKESPAYWTARGAPAVFLQHGPPFASVAPLRSVQMQPSLLPPVGRRG